MPALRNALRNLPAPLKRSIQERVYPALLPEGETAPEWHLQGHDGNWYRQGRHWTIMVFYPEDGAAEDTEQLKSFQEHLPEFERLGVKLFGFNLAEQPSHEKFAKEAGLTFPLMTDRGASVARQFKASLQIPTSPMYIRTVYLVNPERKIRLGNRGTPSVPAILRSIEALQSVSKTGM